MKSNGSATYFIMYRYQSMSSTMLEVNTMSDLPEVSQQEALEVAARCASLLRERFGANRVIPFGSVVGHGRWHLGSDLDLAVEGVAPEAFFRAWSMLRELLPPGLDVDLVSLEHASDDLRARILGEKPMSEEPLVALKDLVEDELAALERIVKAVQEGVSSEEETPSQFAMNALASYLHQFYTGCERILERMAVRVDGGLPGGAFSHANLLAQMAHELPGVRPAILNERLWLSLQDYLAFRHFFRHAYGYTLEWAKLRPLVMGLSATYNDLQSQLRACFDVLLRGA
jgi:predicted nucleotidyltransferase